MATQNQTLRTRDIQKAIDGINISSECRRGIVKEETSNYIANRHSGLNYASERPAHFLPFS